MISVYDALGDLYKPDSKDQTLLILVQGLPGSGKSTFAKFLVQGLQRSRFNYMIKIFEADDYFIKDDEYVFNPKYLGEAHRTCFENVKNELANKHIVICANTFTSDSELKKYYDLAKEYNSEVFLVKMNTQYTSIHNVPEESLLRMKERMKINLITKADYEVNE